MKSVGILTFQNTLNFGAVLQNYALYHATMRMILCSGSFALANTVPLSALNLRSHAGHLYRARPPAEAPSSQQPPCPQAGHAGARPHLSMSPSIVSAPYFSRHVFRQEELSRKIIYF